MGKKTPKISVVMAVYNIGNKDFIDQAIKSIVMQDVNDWELLICDDGSTDNTFKWLTEWEEKDSRIIIYRNNDNKKAGAARNRCIENAKGEYIAIMDADDLCSSNRLRIQSEFLENHENYAFIGLKGERFNQIPGDTDNPYWFCEKPIARDFLMTLPFVHASIMFRAEALKSIGGYDSGEKVQRSEDYDLLMRMYAKGLRGANVKDAIYYIREDDNTLARRKYKYRLIESKVKFLGFRNLGLMPEGIIYAVKPMIVGLIPIKLLNIVKKSYYRSRESSDRTNS